MLTVLSAGLPVSAKDILAKAMIDAFGDAIDIQELTRENLRSRVRLSSKNVEIVLVILDRVSSDLCADIENGLYSSDKYYTYTTDKDFAEFLNGKYNLNIEIEEEIGEISLEQGFESDNEIVRDYEDKIKFKNDIIFNLETRIKDILSFYEDGSFIEQKGNNEELLNVKSQLSVSEAELEELRKSLEGKDVIIHDLDEKIKKLSKNYDSVLSELNELKISSSKQAGVINAKEGKIRELEGIISKLEKSSETIKELNNTLSRYKSELIGKDKDINDLRVDLESKD